MRFNIILISPSCVFATSWSPWLARWSIAVASTVCYLIIHVVKLASEQNPFLVGKPKKIKER